MRDLAHLEPGFRAMVDKALQLLKERGLDVLVTCTYRSWEEQAAEYAKGRTKPGEPCHCGKHPNPVGTCSKHPRGLKVTNARPGQSWHQWGRALDFVPRRSGKTLVWGTRGNGIDQDPTDDNTDDLELWQRCAACFKESGLSWAGDWVSFREYPHVEHRGPWTIHALLAKYPHGLKPGEFV